MATNSLIPHKYSLPLPSSINNKPRHHSPSIVSLHAPEPAKPQSTAAGAAATSAATITSPSVKWRLDSWKSKKALQLPEYPDKNELQSVLKTIEDFPPIVFAGEARRLEERLAEAAMGNAFLLMGGDCAESFKEFNAVNIRDTFRILLQMSVVMMFGGQMPVIKVLFFLLKLKKIEFFLLYVNVGCVWILPFLFFPLRLKKN